MSTHTTVETGTCAQLSCSPVTDHASQQQHKQDPLPADTTNLVLIIQHSDFVPPAYASKFLDIHHIPYHILHLDYPDATLPDIHRKWKAIISLGGPQASYEEDKYSWIKLEKQFLVEHIKQQTPMLCICLAAQMLADAIGGKAYRAEHMEAGYSQVEVTEAGLKDPFVSKLFQSLNPASASPVTSTTSFLMHHGDTFDLPATCPLLASSKFKALYRYGSALAVQFHPEASVNEITLWTSMHPDEYPQINTTGENLVQLVKDRVPEASRASELFFATWWQTHCGFELPSSEQKQ